MKHVPLLFPLLIVLLSGCDPNENVPKASTSGGSGSTTFANKDVALAPTSWAFFVGDASNWSNPNHYRQTTVTNRSRPRRTPGA